MPNFNMHLDVCVDFLDQVSLRFLLRRAWIHLADLPATNIPSAVIWYPGPHQKMLG